LRQEEHHEQIEFHRRNKRDAVRQITKRGYPASEVSQRLGVHQHSLYESKKKFAASNAKGNAKRVHRIMGNHAMLLEKHTAFRKGRLHDGKVMAICSSRSSTRGMNVVR
jgi:transposase